MKSIQETSWKVTKVTSNSSNFKLERIVVSYKWEKRYPSGKINSIKWNPWMGEQEPRRWEFLDVLELNSQLLSGLVMLCYDRQMPLPTWLLLWFHCRLTSWPQIPLIPQSQFQARMSSVISPLLQLCPDCPLLWNHRFSANITLTSSSASSYVISAASFHFTRAL